MGDEKKCDTGGAAFSRAPVMIQRYGQSYAEYSGGQSGMTLLDWFAGQALAGMMSCSEGLRVLVDTSKELSLSLSECAAVTAYDRAAAMIAEKRRREAGDE